MHFHRLLGQKSISASLSALEYTGFIWQDWVLLSWECGGQDCTILWKSKTKGILDRNWRNEHHTITSSSIISSCCHYNPQYKLPQNAGSLLEDYLYQCRLWSTGCWHLITEIKPWRLTWSWACWTSFTRHRSAKLSKHRALSVCYFLSHKSSSTNPLPFISFLTNESFRPINVFFFVGLNTVWEIEIAQTER